jgi:hypothetical protein
MSLTPSYGRGLLILSTKLNPPTSSVVMTNKFVPSGKESFELSGLQKWAIGDKLVMAGG